MSYVLSLRHRKENIRPGEMEHAYHFFQEGGSSLTLRERCHASRERTLHLEEYGWVSIGLTPTADSLNGGFTLPDANSPVLAIKFILPGKPQGTNISEYRPDFGGRYTINKGVLTPRPAPNLETFVNVVAADKIRPLIFNRMDRGGQFMKREGRAFFGHLYQLFGLQGVDDLPEEEMMDVRDMIVGTYAPDCSYQP
jgi:hypothetical protein